jgi:hypothetical protein
MRMGAFWGIFKESGPKNKKGGWGFLEILVST